MVGRVELLEEIESRAFFVKFNLLELARGRFDFDDSEDAMRET